MEELSQSAAGTPRRKRSRPAVALIVAGCLVATPVLLLMIARVLGYPSFSVPTGSMEGTILVGDNLIASKWQSEPERGKIIVFVFPGNRDQAEPDQFEYYVERCVALAGDTVEVRDHRAFVNGVKESIPPKAIFAPEHGGDNSSLTFPVGAGFTGPDWGPMRVPMHGDVLPLSVETIRAWEIFIRREGHQVETWNEGVLIDGTLQTSYTVNRDYCFALGDNRANSADSRYWGFVPVENVTARPLFVYWSSGSDREGIRWNRIFTSIE